MMSPIKHSLFRCAALLLLCATTSVQAAVFCVRNTSELQTAALQIPFSPGDNVIRMAAGTYSLSSPLTINAAGFINPGQITILGGYNADCSARSLDPNATVIQGTNASAQFHVNSRVKSITVDGLSLQQLPAAFGHIDGGITETVPPRLGQRVTLRRVRTTQSKLLFPINSYDVRIENLLKVGGTELRFWRDSNNTQGTPIVEMVNSTVVNAELIMVCTQNFVACPLPGAHLRVYNSVFTRPGDAIELLSAWLTSHHNLLSGVNVQDGGAILSQTGNLSTPAALDSNYRPLAGSPAIDSGTVSVPGNLPGTDHGGGPRILGATVDRGALESPFSTGTIHTVTNINDSGPGSLRQAITNAQINGGHQFVRFNIPGQCPRRIALQSPLPTIGHSLMIDGHSQPGTTMNSSDSGWNAEPCVLVSGNNTVTQGLMTGLNSRLRVYGLGFEGFTSAAISIIAGNEHVIEGNQFGGTIFNALDLLPNQNHISVGLGGRYTRIGGPLPHQRNLLSGATSAAVTLGIGSSDNAVVNNLIGMRRNLFQSDPNQHGIVINRSSDNEISGNRIYGNSLDGIRILGTDATGNVIRDNRFSATLLSSGLGNGRHAVSILNDARDTEIGPGNFITNHTQSAIRIAEGRRHRVWGNQIDSGSALALDIGDVGVNPIINGSGLGSCTGPSNANCRRNAPELLQAWRDTSQADAPQLVAEFVLRAPTGQHEIELYASDECQGGSWSGSGPGAKPLGSIGVNALNGNNPNTDPWIPRRYRLQLPLEPGDLPELGSAITAIATDSGGNSSEFSRCAALDNDRIFRNGFQCVSLNLCL